MSNDRAKQIVARARRAGLTGRVIGRASKTPKGRRCVSIRNQYGYIVTSRFEVANNWIKLGR